MLAQSTRLSRPDVATPLVVMPMALTRDVMVLLALMRSLSTVAHCPVHGFGRLAIKLWMSVCACVT